LFANLKRETDDINALKAKKTHHRQIISNWSRYEEPLPGPDHEAELQGADFEALLKAPISGQMILSVLLKFISVGYCFLCYIAKLAYLTLWFFAKKVECSPVVSKTANVLIFLLFFWGGGGC
jgi:hypothetical protein